MICGYENIYDLCENQFSYTYATVIIFNDYAVADTGNNAAVYRTDKNNNTTILLEPGSSLPIKTCALDDNNEDFTAWDCYLWYKNTNGVIGNPPLEDYQIVQIEYINTIYQNLLDNGILIKIDNFATNMSTSDGAYANVVVSETANYTILLPAKNDDIINFTNILSLATLLNNNNSSDPIPPLIDYYNNAHFLNYYNLTNILVNYFNKLKYYENLKDTLIQKVLNAQSISDVQAQVFHTNISVLNSNKATNYSKSNSTIIKFNSLTCEEINNICDPPCNIDNCEACIDGSCSSLCAEGQCCYNGSCIDCLSCELNSDCNVCESNYVTRADYTYDNCNGSINASIGCIDCEVLASICDDVGGTYYEVMTLYGKVCNCQDTPSFATSLNNCDHLMSTEKDYAGIGYDFESGIGYCCDNQCQIDPC